MSKTLKAGVLGAGHLGKIHLRLLNQSNKFDLVGFYDASPDVRKKITDEYGFKAFDSEEDLIAAVDVVDIVTPTLYHHKLAKKAIEMGKKKMILHARDSALDFYVSLGYSIVGDQFEEVGIPHHLMEKSFV